MTDNNSFWNLSAKAGFTLGGISILYLAFTALGTAIGSESAAVSVIFSVLNFILWTAKLFVCFFLLRGFMRLYSSQKADSSASVFKFGMSVAALSALVYSAAYLAYVLFVAPDTFSQVMDALLSSPLYDSNTKAAMSELTPKLPAISFFSNFVWCFLYGTILSAFISRSIGGGSSSNPFRGEGIGNEQ